MAARTASRYKHVGFHGASLGWVAQKRGVGYRARFPSDMAAARWLAARMGVALANLRIGSRAPGRVQRELRMSRYRGVVLSRGRWIARARGNVVGRFPSEILAAQRVARCLGVPVHTLMKKSRGGDCVARRIFTAAFQVFSGYVPGDLVSMYQHEADSAKMFAEEPLVHAVLWCTRSRQHAMKA